MQHAESQSHRQKGGRWSAWMAASGLLHATLLGVLVLFAGAGDGELRNFRVRLVRETSVSLVPLAPERGAPPLPVPVVPLRSTVRGADPRVQSRRAESPVPDASQGMPSSSIDAAQDPSGRGPGPADRAAEPGGDPEPVGPAGSIGEGKSRSATPRPGPASPPADPGPRAAPAPLEALAKGISMLPPGRGSGTGHAGRGMADRGIGAGGSVSRQSGQGNAGDGSGGARGSAGGRMASRGGGGGDGSGRSAADLLQAIRSRIEQAKVYPDEARRAGLQGTVEIRFRIGPDGSAEALEIVRSSGHTELDETSLQTIRRAAPYPVVTGRIRIPLSYRLDE